MAPQHPVESTSALLDRARDGDTEARERLVTRFLPRLRRWAHGRLPVPARGSVDTDDLVQVTLLRALDRLHTFEPQGEGAFLAFLRRILLNQIRDELRRSRPREDVSGVTVAYDWEWAEGERLFRKALELKPNDAEGHRLYGDYLKCTGRSEEAIAEAKRARDLDPFSATVDYQLGNVLYFTRRYDEAIAVLQAPREGDPLVSHILLGFAYLQKDEHEKARAEFVKVSEMSGGNPIFLAPLAAGHAAAGWPQEARALLRKMEDAKGVMAFPLAFVHVRLGDNDRAFASLERAYRNREFFMGCLRSWPELDRLRSDPRYDALVERMRFPPWGQPAAAR